MNARNLLAAAATAALLPLAAFAQCRSDVECKGQRICVQGQCVDPGPSRATPAPPPPAARRAPGYDVQLAGAPSPGWGRTGGYVGLVGAGTMFGLALVAEGMNSSGEDATPVGVTAILAGSAGALFAGMGSASVSGVEHSTPLRIVGWVAYGLALGDALVMVATSDVQKPSGLITSVGALGLVGVTSLSVEAIMSAGDAERALAARAAGLSVTPWIAPIRLADGSTRAGFGLAGRF